MKDAQGPELFFGIVGPIGTDLDTLCELLAASLDNVAGYRYETIRLISLVRELEPWRNLPDKPVAEYYHKAMDAGDQFRQQVGNGNALAVLAMRFLRDRIRTKYGLATQPVQRMAYIFRSLKHPEEVEELRKTYGGAFFLIGAYSPKELRVENLAHKIAGSEVTDPRPEHKLEAERLIQRDESESGVKLGQAVRDSFPLADVFVDVSKPRDQIRQALVRFIELIFGYPFHTPTRQEFGMFHALASALRSSAMGRQVGASICNYEGDVIAVGTNEVPKAFGGQYWGDEPEDRRDFQLGIDSNDELKRQNLAEVLLRLQEADWLSDKKTLSPIDDLVSEAAGILKGTRSMSPIEYGRAVHAEMSAIIDAARRGVSVSGTVLFCTTFPCHECARHIICAGIKEVYYVEPYPKSLALDLHKDAVSVEEDGKTDNVVFLPFVGIAPRQYLNLFAMKTRKDTNGRSVVWVGRTAMPLNPGPFKSYFEAEDWAGAELKQRMEETQLSLI